MSDHVIHLCPVRKDVPAVADGRVWGAAINWPYEEIPLNKRRHEACPHCKTPTSEMKSASADMVILLNTGGSSKGRGSRTAADAQVQALRSEIAELTKLIKGDKK